MYSPVSKIYAPYSVIYVRARHAFSHQTARQVHVLERLMEEAGSSGPLSLLRASIGRPLWVVTRHRCGLRGVARGTIVAFDRHLNLVLRDVDETYTVLLRVPRVVSERPRPPPPAGGDEGKEAAGGQAQLETGELAGGREEGEADPEEPCSGPGPAVAGHGYLPGLVAGCRGSVPPGLTEPGPGEPGKVIRWFRKQEWRQRHLAQIFVRGDAVVAVSQQRPSLNGGNPNKPPT